MIYLRHGFFIVVMIILSACASTGEVITVTPTDMPVTLTMTLPPPADTPFPTKTIEPTPMVAVPAPMDTATPRPVLQLCSPLAEQTLSEIPEIVSDPYNPPRLDKDDRHHGTDFAYYRRKDRLTNEGEVVQAMMAGQVVAVVKDQLPYGNMVIIETESSSLPSEVQAQIGIAENESLYILYAHFGNPPLVALGDAFECGRALGDVGATGYNIVNPHLHLETRVGPAGMVFANGMAFYDTQTTEAERSNYELWRTGGEFRHFDPMDLINTYLQNWAGE